MHVTGGSSEQRSYIRFMLGHPVIPREKPYRGEMMVVTKIVQCFLPVFLMPDLINHEMDGWDQQLCREPGRILCNRDGVEGRFGKDNRV